MANPTYFGFPLGDDTLGDGPEASRSLQAASHEHHHCAACALRAAKFADAIFTTGEELLGTLRGSGVARQALRVGSLATLSRNFQMAFLRPVLGRTDIDLILRSGSAAELLRALEALNLDVVLLNQAPAADALTPFVTHRLAERSVSLVGTGSPARDRQSRREAAKPPDHPADAR